VRLYFGQLPFPRDDAATMGYKPGKTTFGFGIPVVVSRMEEAKCEEYALLRRPS
jgi:hypothetical protein